MGNTRQRRAHCINDILRRLYPVIPPLLHWQQPHECLFAVMLSAQTTDAQVNKVTPYLFSIYPHVSDWMHLDTQHVAHIGLYRTKAKNIRATAQIVVNVYHGVIPSTMSALVTLPGVGRKTANIVLSDVYNIYDGIAVDTHVARLSKLYGLTDQIDPVKIEQDLIKVIPRSDWRDFSKRMVLYGREYCPARCKTCITRTCPLWSCKSLKQIVSPSS